MAQKPSIPKGTRDFSPSEVNKRNYIFDVVKKHFQTYGFQPIETPSFENSETLMGKYGDEGDRLIFKILNSGDFLNKVNDELYSTKDSSALTSKISEKALRYDLTVPFARYVVMHQNEIDFPFKRYQIQPVWHADRPQKGRFREFFQCDADVVGSDSLLQEVELVQLYDAVFTDLKLDGVTIKLNNRKILAGIAEVIGERDKLIDFTVALDKLDKIGIDGVSKEMREKNISEAAINKAAPLFALKGTNLEQLSVLDGAIFEVAAPEGVSMGSIGGGGRYDDLTGIFGLKDVSGVGISFGLDRIYLVLEELGLFPEAIDQSLQVLCVNFGDKEALTSLKLVNQLRRAGIKCDLYPSSAKMQKQMKYANNRNVPYVVLIGEKEISDNSFVVRDMVNGGQTEYSLNNVDQFLKQL